MSIETGPNVGYVYVTEDGLNGSTREALVATRGAMFEEQADEHIVAALDEIIASDGPGRDTIDRFIEDGRYLYGTTEYKKSWNDGAEQPLDAILYAEVDGLLDSGAFSVVRMATWVRRSTTERGLTYDNRTLHEYLAEVTMTDVSKEDEGDVIWGIPVERSTVIRDFADNEGYVFGHKQELQAIAGLEIDARLKDVLTLVTASWHSSELARNGKASFADVQDALHDQWF